ncbi:nucleotidyltransferase domain-containing protein [Staphylococcus aureus]
MIILKKHKQILEQYIFSSKSVLGAFYGGSIARDDSDIYSDIDLRILVDESLDKSKILIEFINLFEDKLFIENQDDGFVVLHLNNLLKIDIFVFYAKDLSPNIWLSNICIIKDNENFLEYIKFNSENVVRVTPERIISVSNKFLAYLIESYKRYERNETFYVVYSINMMSNILCHLWYLRSGKEPNVIGDWSKYEGDRTKLNDNEIRTLNDILSKSYFEQREILSKEFLKVLSDIDKKYNFNTFKDKEYIVNLIFNNL